jgi:hypothetical protein
MAKFYLLEIELFHVMSLRLLLNGIQTYPVRVIGYNSIHAYFIQIFDCFEVIDETPAGKEDFPVFSIATP